MPKIHQSNDEIKFDKDLILLLKDVQKIYESKVGTYQPSWWKEINENKIASFLKAIKSLIEYYEKFGNLTPKQCIFAKKLIKNGIQLTK